MRPGRSGRNALRSPCARMPQGTADVARAQPRASVGLPVAGGTERGGTSAGRASRSTRAVAALCGTRPEVPIGHRRRGNWLPALRRGRRTRLRSDAYGRCGRSGRPPAGRNGRPKALSPAKAFGRTGCGARSPPLAGAPPQQRPRLSVPHLASDRIQLTSRRASVSLMADALGGIARPLTLPFQWLLYGLEPSSTTRVRKSCAPGLP